VLRKKINQHIQNHGHMTVDEYMALCLYDPDDGYYKTKSCIGAQGDFITAPEISQLFGEIIAFWLINQWQQEPAILPRHLIELGPGRGTLMADILRTLNKINSDYICNLTVHLVETSPTLIAQQQHLLSSYGHTVVWHATLLELTAKLPKQHCYFIANEFFDALPIQQLQWHNQAWHQRVIQQQSIDNSLCWDLIPFQGLIPYETYYPLPQHGNILEFSLQQLQHVDLICQHIRQGHNAALIIDYGYDYFSYGDTFQAMHQHQYVSPLEDSGQCDLTAHINFAALAQHGHKYNLNTQLLTQAEFLINYGIDARLRQLLQANPMQTDALKSGYDRLVDMKQMGELFKVLILQ